MIVKLRKEDIYKGYLILVNSSYLLQEEIDGMNLEKYSSKYSNIYYEKIANLKLQFILEKIGAEGKIVPVSGYRTLKEQQYIFNDSLLKNGESFTRKYVALPNASEHQTGLAIDLGLNEGELDFIRPSFPHKGICEDFRKEAFKYGFIERYKANKETITGISAEEWHFRYVGYPHSEYMEENNLCLEEYILLLKQKKLDYKGYEISYIPYNGSILELELGEGESISGNNIDGFILTRRKV